MAEARKGFVQFKGSERPRVAESKLIGALKPEEIVSVTLLVRPRPGSPPLPEFSDWQKTPPGERKFLSVEEYTATYGASEADLKAVVVFIESYGLTVVESHSGRRNVIVSTLIAISLSRGAPHIRIEPRARRCYGPRAALRRAV